jgi:hypothetical protein
MPKPRYDEEENVSRHAATDADCCQEMADKYGWFLKRIELIENTFTSCTSPNTRQRFKSLANSESPLKRTIAVLSRVPYNSIPLNPSC